MRRKLAVVAISSVLFFNFAPARAAIFTGTCVMNLDFEFSTPIRSATSFAAAERRSTSYNIGGFGAADLNPLTDRFESCVVDNDPLNPFKVTSASGDGNAIAWYCEAAAGSGSWTQDWDPDPGAVVGSHTIAGTWGNWVMVVSDPTLNFTGTINLTVAPSDETKLRDCELNGISNLRMTGVMHFQDPPISS